jgi:hypothetical protein
MKTTEELQPGMMVQLRSPQGEKDGIWGIRSIHNPEPDQEFQEGDQVELVQAIGFLDYWVVQHPAFGQWLVRAIFFQTLPTGP